MAAIASSRALGRPSGETYSEKAVYIGSHENNNPEILDSSLSAPQPKPSAHHTSSNRNLLNKASRCLLKLISVVQTMGCKSASNRAPQGIRPTYFSEYSPTPTIREKTPTIQPSNQRNDSFVSEKPVRSWLIAHTGEDARVDSSKIHVDKPTRSTNTVYEPSVLFSDETLQFADAFFPPMAPIEIWGPPTAMDDGIEVPSSSWRRRHTCIRPGHVVQVPSATNKGATYLLSCQTELGAKREIDLVGGNNRSRKLFMAQVGGDAEQPMKYSKAFIMREPGSEL
ncbi:hypothetical protein RSOLAG1IB_09588 [Rhizoctonia solani AG-1 IB]|uniref:Uncharacterized protein n=1 Tax=Thanatephorus cucumeris (strain AG1-IB / isolate 7/3/14) TaxID=1108050 RepID=A0A0B7FRQ5_THACB|nr:hypothetical protein RSOLAG1IB_09588 [Rhizoctonia solani AG-1 IB]